jgi:hypothetical protein
LTIVEHFQKLCNFLQKISFFLKILNISTSNIISAKAGNLLGYAKSSVTKVSYKLTTSKAHCVSSIMALSPSAFFAFFFPQLCDTAKSQFSQIWLSREKWKETNSYGYGWLPT